MIQPYNSTEEYSLAGLQNFPAVLRYLQPKRLLILGEARNPIYQSSISGTGT